MFIQADILGISVNVGILTRVYFEQFFATLLEFVKMGPTEFKRLKKTNVYINSLQFIRCTSNLMQSNTTAMQNSYLCEAFNVQSMLTQLCK